MGPKWAQTTDSVRRDSSAYYALCEPSVTVLAAALRTGWSVAVQRYAPKGTYGRPCVFVLVGAPHSFLTEEENPPSKKWRGSAWRFEHTNVATPFVGEGHAAEGPLKVDQRGDDEWGALCPVAALTFLALPSRASLSRAVAAPHDGGALCNDGSCGSCTSRSFAPHRHICLDR